MRGRRIILSILKVGVKFLSGYNLSRFYLVRAAYIFLISRLRNPEAIADVQGHKMFLDRKDSLRLSVLGFYEPFVTKLFREKIKTGDVVLDLGANIGYHTLISAELVGENGRVYAFEPNPDSFALLKKNVEINEYKNIVLVQKAVSNKTGKGKLYLSEFTPEDHKIYDSHDGRKFIEIETIRLDDYFQNYNGKIDFIKMDIQGAEGKALQGASLLLQKNKNIKIVTEFQPILLRECGTEPKEYLELLSKHGFSLYNIKRKIKLTNIAELLKRYTPEIGNDTNLLCIRKDGGLSNL